MHTEREMNEVMNLIAVVFKRTTFQDRAEFLRTDISECKKTIFCLLSIFQYITHIFIPKGI